MPPPLGTCCEQQQVSHFSTVMVSCCLLLHVRGVASPHSLISVKPVTFTCTYVRVLAVVLFLCLASLSVVPQASSDV